MMRNAAMAMIALALAGAVEARTDARAGADRPAAAEREESVADHREEGREVAVLGAGCFWCVEAVFQRLDGVVSVMPGYAGGDKPNPTYEEVCGGRTGHAEVARVEFDPERISYQRLLDVFWRAHDPTTLNRQGADVGTQYRSAIFYADGAQRAAAEASKQAAQSEFGGHIVTEIVPLDAFYPAEDYHRDYYNRNRQAPYCRAVIAPKLRKLGLE